MIRQFALGIGAGIACALSVGAGLAQTAPSREGVLALIRTADFFLDCQALRDKDTLPSTDACVLIDAKRQVQIRIWSDVAGRPSKIRIFPSSYFDATVADAAADVDRVSYLLRLAPILELYGFSKSSFVEQMARCHEDPERRNRLLRNGAFALSVSCALIGNAGTGFVVSANQP